MGHAAQALIDVTIRLVVCKHSLLSGLEEGREEGSKQTRWAGLAMLPCHGLDRRCCRVPQLAAGVPRLKKSISRSAATGIGLSRYPIRQLTSGPTRRQAGSLKPGDASGHHHRTAICCARTRSQRTQAKDPGEGPRAQTTRCAALRQPLQAGGLSRSLLRSLPSTPGLPISHLLALHPPLQGTRAAALLCLCLCLWWWWPPRI